MLTMNTYVCPVTIAGMEKKNGKYKNQFIGMSGKMDKEEKLKYTYILKC